MCLSLDVLLCQIITETMELLWFKMVVRRSNTDSSIVVVIGLSSFWTKVWRIRHWEYSFGEGHIFVTLLFLSPCGMRPCWIYSPSKCLYHFRDYSSMARVKRGQFFSHVINSAILFFCLTFETYFLMKVKGSQQSQHSQSSKVIKSIGNAKWIYLKLS